MEVLTRLDLDLAYSAEKLVNLEILLMQMSAWENDCELVILENTCISEESCEKALVYDLLSGILDSEVRELDYFINTRKLDILNANKNQSPSQHFEEFFAVSVEEKLHDSEECLKQLQQKVLDMKLHSEKLQGRLSSIGRTGYTGMDISQNGGLLNINANLKMQTVEQQRQILRMLEKSLARELDLERKLIELKQSEEELKLKLHLKEQQLFFLEEQCEGILAKLLEAENASEVLLGISKEFMSRVQIVQINLNGSFQRESKIQDCIEQVKSKETALQNHENNKVKLFVEKPNNVNNSNGINGEKFIEMENIIVSLKESIYKAENRAEIAETKLTLLSETNMELTEELGFLKGADNHTEEKVRKLEIQLQHAKAASKASQEQQNMLYSAIWDMETLIEDLKSKVTKGENKSEHLEEQCLLLSETNFELNKEVSILRSRMECLEEALQQANDAKLETAKDVNVKTKYIMDMVMQLAIERERIQEKMDSLTKENEILADKVREI